MKMIIDLLRAIGLAGTLGVLSIPVGVALATKEKLWTLDFLSTDQGTRVLIGLLLVVLGVILLGHKLIQDARELLSLRQQSRELTTEKNALLAEQRNLSSRDHTILRAQILSNLNRQAILNHNPHNEDLKAQFSGLRDVRAALQSVENQIENPALRASVRAMVQMLLKIEENNPWANGQRFPELLPELGDFRYLNEWCWAAMRADNQHVSSGGPDAPRYTGPSFMSQNIHEKREEGVAPNFYGPMIGWVRVRLDSLELVMKELQALTLTNQSAPWP